MKNILTKVIFLFIAFQLFFSCQTTKIEKPTKIEMAQKEGPKTIKIENVYYFFLAGDKLWVFFKDRFEVIKSPTEKDVVFFEEFKSDEPCILPLRPIGGLQAYAPEYTDCIPRPPRMHMNGLKRFFSEIFDRGYWVLDSEVVIQLGKQLYFFTFEGKFLRIENRKKGWQFEELPFSKYDWRYDEKGFHFKGKKFEPGNPAVFSGRWVLRKKGRMKKKKLHLVDRATAEYRRTFEAADPPRGRDLIEFREYGGGVYIDRRRQPEFKNDIMFPHRRPAWWFGRTIIDLRNDDPTTHCYVFKEKKKCIPIPTPCTIVNKINKCIPLSKRSYPRQSLRGVLETDKMLIKVYDKELGIEFKTTQK